MKNLRILLFIVAASLFAACDDAIDITQPGELLPEDTFTSLADMQLGLNGVYGTVGGETAIVFTSIFTDEVRVGRANGGQGVNDGGLSFVLNSNSGDAATIWLNNYTTINFANRLIEGSKGIALAEGEDITYNNIIGQARALRAYAHMQLLTYFSTNMKDDTALGVIALDFVPTKEQQLPRNTNGEVYTLIESDLQFASENVGTGNLATRDYITRDVVTAIRARLAAYRGQYDQAEAFANTLITSATSPTYGLAPKGTVNLSLNTAQLIASLTSASGGSPYFKIFRDLPTGAGAAANEVIFKLVKPVTPNPGNFYQAWSSVNSSTTGGAFFEVSTALFNKLAVEDVRRITIIDPSAVAGGYNVRPVGKYGLSKGTNLLADVKLFRNSEMYLIRAEAQANRSDFAAVAATINTVRDARFGNTTANGLTVGRIGVPASAQEAWAAILNERRIELAFEGHRYIDIKRLGAAAGAGIDRVSAECVNFGCSLELTDYRWTLPIPRQEITANPNIKQNPGY